MIKHGSSWTHLSSGGFYDVIRIAIDHETEQPMVIYENDHCCWARPVDEWLDKFTPGYLSGDLLEQAREQAVEHRARRDRMFTTKSAQLEAEERDDSVTIAGKVDASGVQVCCCDTMREFASSSDGRSEHACDWCGEIRHIHRIPGPARQGQKKSPPG
jgi:hypothetical protein